MNETKNYSLYIVIDNNKILLKKDSLKNIDSFTTWFKNQDVLKNQLLKDINTDNKSISILIENVKHTKVDFIGSDFRNVINHYNDNGYINYICQLDFKILYEYFNDYFSNLLQSKTTNPEAYDKLYDEYMSNDKIPFVMVIKSLENILNSEKFKTREMRNDTEVLDAKVNAKYHIRRYNSKYKLYRNMYCEMVGIGLYDQGKISYSSEEKHRIIEELNMLNQKIKEELSEDYQMEFAVDKDNKIVVDNNDKNSIIKSESIKEDENIEDINFDLEYIESDEKENSDKAIACQSIINSPFIDDENRFDELSKIIDDPEEFNKYVNDNKEKIKK